MRRLRARSDRNRLKRLRPNILIAMAHWEKGTFEGAYRIDIDGKPALTNNAQFPTPFPRQAPLLYAPYGILLTNLGNTATPSPLWSSPNRGMGLDGRRAGAGDTKRQPLVFLFPTAIRSVDAVYASWNTDPPTNFHNLEAGLREENRAMPGDVSNAGRRGSRGGPERCLRRHHGRTRSRDRSLRRRRPPNDDRQAKLARAANPLWTKPSPEPITRRSPPTERPPKTGMGKEPWQKFSRQTSLRVVRSAGIGHITESVAKIGVVISMKSLQGTLLLDGGKLRGSFFHRAVC